MSELDYARSVLLGALQGITEFLPISSSAHLALGERWLAIDPGSPAMLLFDVMVHVGTVAAVLVVFRASVARFFHGLVRGPDTDGSHLQDDNVSEATGATRVRSSARPEGRGSGIGRRASLTGAPLSLPRRRRPAVRILLLGIVAGIPTGVVGLLFKDTFEAAFDRPVWIGVCLIITGGLLMAMSRVPRGRRGWRRFRWWHAGLVGLAQAGAILPGISRSGATICVASFCSLRRRWAAEFSFFIAVPAILGGTLLKLRDTFTLEASELATIPWGPIILGAIAAFVVGIAALRVLLRVVHRAKLHHFAWYCWGLAVVVLLTF